jgi:hypothetical protein
MVTLRLKETKNRNVFNDDCRAFRGDFCAKAQTGTAAAQQAQSRRVGSDGARRLAVRGDLFRRVIVALEQGTVALQLLPLASAVVQALSQASSLLAD